MQIVKRLTHVLVLVLTLVIGAAAAAVIVSQTAWFKNWLRGYIVREANQYLNGTLSIERLGGSLLFGIEMENIGVSVDGQQVVAVKDLGLDYSIFELLSKGLSVDNIRLDKPVIYLRREGDTWSLSRLVKKQAAEADRRGPEKPIAIEDIGISDGSVVIDSPVGTSGVDVPRRIEHLDAKLSFKYEPVHYSIEITHVSFRGSEPALAVNALSGGVAVKDDTLFVEKLALRTAESSVSVNGAVQQYLSTPIFNLEISSDKLSLPEIAQLVPALKGVKLQPSFNAKFAGPLDHLGVEMNVQSSAGLASAKVVADLQAPRQSVAGDLSVKHLDLSAIVAGQQKSDMTADGRVNVRGDFSNLHSLRGDAELDAPRVVAAGYVAEKIHATMKIEGTRIGVDGRAVAYGASATASGRVTLPQGKEPLSYDLHGVAHHVDLRQLPKQAKVPPAATNVNASYHVTGVASGRMTGDLRFEPSTIAGATIASGSTAGFSVNGKEIGYKADATVADLDLQRVGKAFNILALAADRYKSSINGHIVASGHGTTPKEMDVIASGTLHDTTLMGGRIPQLAFDASMARDTAHVKANGSFADVDPAVAGQNPRLEGKVAGTLDIDATLAHVSEGVAPDSVQADGKVTLGPSNVGGLDIARANLDASYHDSTGDIRAFEITGRDLNATASGTLALDDTGQSNLKVHADTPSLEQIGKLVDQPLSGIGKVDATITGNRKQLQATGNVTGDGVTYGENGALTLSSDYTARVPDLTFEAADVTATTHATFVSVGGQNINELDAKTTYHEKQIDFDATAKQPQRSLTANGALLLHPEHQEVHLKALGLTSQGVQWQTAPNTEAAIEYGGDAVTIKNLELVNADQKISVEGSFGHPGDALKVTMNNIDVATFDALMLRAPQLSGRLNANSTITGTTDAPRVKATFRVDKGGFRQFHYDNVHGDVDYSGRGITVDTRLEQSPTAWIQATGYVPVAAFTDAENGAHREGTPRENSFDLHVDSSPIDLGIIQGFTTQLTNVTGTVQAKVDITGAAGDPHPIGGVTIQNAAFTVEPTGVTYTDLDGKIDLQADKVHIDEIRILDNQKKPMTFTGDLAVHEREVGSVSVAMKAHDFKVLDNKLGNIRIDSDLRLTGQLNAPRLEGSLGLTTGRVDLDQILGQVGDSAYDTKQTEYITQTTDAKGQKAPPTAFEALQMYVHLTLPNDFVVKANNLAAPGAPIGLGALNVTLGGDLYASKVPWDQIRLIGVVNTVRGSYDFQGRRFTILRDGTVRFSGLDDLDPSLDIRTERVIRAVTANVNLRGTLKEPEIVLTSTPALEQADILSLIVFNQNLNDVSEGQQINLIQRAEAMAGGAVASEFAKSIGDALNLDTFEINLAPENGGGPQVTLGQQVSENLFVKVQQGIGDQSQTNVVIEYELAKWLRLQTNVLQGSSTQQQLFQRMQGSGVDLLFFFSY
jgi:autotransporter translocation and assembly factor TamB